MTEEKLTSAILLSAAKEIEAKQADIADYKMRFGQLYGQMNGNLLKEVLEQRAIEREAAEYADMLIRSADMPDEEE